MGGLGMPFPEGKTSVSKKSAMTEAPLLTLKKNRICPRSMAKKTTRHDMLADIGEHHNHHRPPQECEQTAGQSEIHSAAQWMKSVELRKGVLDGVASVILPTGIAEVDREF